MKTLKEQMENYIQHCYPSGITGTQSNEVRQAFMAGAFSALSEVAILSDCKDDPQSEAEAGMKIGQLIQEGEDWCRLRSVSLNTSPN